MSLWSRFRPDPAPIPSDDHLKEETERRARKVEIRSRELQAERDANGFGRIFQVDALDTHHPATRKAHP